MEREVGEEFKYSGDILKVEENKDRCKKCYFNSFGNCATMIDSRGKCIRRKDEKDIIFVKVGEYNRNAESPLGVISYKIWIIKRYDELSKAINRYKEGKIEIPKEWIKEYKSHLKYLKKEGVI